jgi:hypothetical protein
MMIRMAARPQIPPKTPPRITIPFSLSPSLELGGEDGEEVGIALRDPVEDGVCVDVVEVVAG